MPGPNSSSKTKQRSDKKSKQSQGDSHNNKRNNKQKGKWQEAPVISDPRFASLHTDPRFQKINKNQMKVTIDNRFKDVFQNKEFKTLAKVDRYGRKTNDKKNDEQLKKYYKLQDEDHDNDHDEQEDIGISEDSSQEDHFSSSSEHSEDEGEDVEQEFDPARGIGVIGTSSDEDSASDLEEDEPLDEEDDAWNVYDQQVPTGDETKRLAVVNLDWDHIRSKDIFKVFDAFKPKNGYILSVRIYPSEFGKERMAREEVEGPPVEIFKDKGQYDEMMASGAADAKSQVDQLLQSQKGDGSDEFDEVMLRKYQLERLRYYYAVVECDSIATAKSIYEQCDGLEFEKSSCFMDIRYIPEDMTFEDSPRDECSEPPSVYEPKDFNTLALQHSRVKLTWDEDDPERVKVTRRKFTKEDIKKMDFDAYIASASDEEENDEEDVDKIRQKYRALLLGDDADAKKDKEDDDSDADEGKENADKSEEEQEMEITFTSGLSKKAEELLKRKQERDAEKEMSVFEKQMKKQKEKRKNKKKGQEEVNEFAPSQPFSDEEVYIDSDDDFFKIDDEEFQQPPTSEKKSKTKEQKKEEKQMKAQDKMEKEKQRAELELLMMGDDSQGVQVKKHFDARQILKSEKVSKLKPSKAKKQRRNLDETLLQDDFKINLEDPRFSAVFDSHHFAIDPTNPQFKKTKEMKKVLEKRRMKAGERHGEVDGAAVAGEKKTARSESTPQNGNVDKLVEKLKRKASDHSAKNAGKKMRV